MNSDQLYQLGSLYGHSKSAEKQSTLIAQQDKQIQLLQKQLEAIKNDRTMEVKRMEAEVLHRQERIKLDKLLKDRIRSIRNTLVDADSVISRIEKSFKDI